MSQCSVSIDELNHDLNTAMTPEEEVDFLAKEQADIEMQVSHILNNEPLCAAEIMLEDEEAMESFAALLLNNEKTTYFRALGSTLAFSKAIEKAVRKTVEGEQ